MPEYIEREEAKDVMALIVLEAIAHPDTYTCGEAKIAIESIPIADVQPVKHGKWGDSIAKYGILRHKCSVCNKYSHMAYNYCPNCGAKMENKDDV